MQIDFTTTAKNPVDILILSNGPGELTTWVRPVVKALRQRLGDDREQVRISLVLSPCPNASGREGAIAQTYAEIDRIQPADQFFPFLLWGKTAKQWDWRDRGVVLFLGGDQFFAVVIGKRLGYSIVIYGEWETRWHQWGDRYGVMNSELANRVPRPYAHKCVVVGDLMAEAADLSTVPMTDTEKQRLTALMAPPTRHLIGLLPGSKPLKLTQGLPLTLAIAHHIHQTQPQTRFVIPVAPSLDLSTLARFADPQANPLVQQFPDGEALLVKDVEGPYLKTCKGVRVDLWTGFPAYPLLAQCQLCLTTVGANTAELGALAVPMLVLIPTQQLDAMRAWDGLPGLLVNLPGVGSLFAKAINGWFLRKTRLLAWPNIWAKEMIVPEMVGKLQPPAIAATALNLLQHPHQLEAMKQRLRNVRGEPGAAAKLANLVVEVIQEIN